MDSAGHLPGWCVLDVFLAASKLGWVPAISLEDGIRTMLDRRVEQMEPVCLSATS
jgi:hypothetical protein